MDLFAWATKDDQDTGPFARCHCGFHYHWHAWLWFQEVRYIPMLHMPWE